jgi:hypothetical protein
MDDTTSHQLLVRKCPAMAIGYPDSAGIYPVLWIFNYLFRIQIRIFIIPYPGPTEGSGSLRTRFLKTQLDSCNLAACLQNSFPLSFLSRTLFEFFLLNVFNIFLMLPPACSLGNCCGLREAESL